MTIRRSPELEDLARQGRAAAESGDYDWLERHTASGEVISFGTAPEEFWRGREEIIRLQQERAVEKINEQAGIKPEIDEVEGYEAGDAGWIVTHGRFVFSEGSVPFRSVVVVVREDGEWKMGLIGAGLVASNDLISGGSPLAT